MGFKPIHGGAQLSVKNQFWTSYRRCVKLNFLNANLTDQGDGKIDVQLNVTFPPDQVLITTSNITIPAGTNFLLCNNSSSINVTLPPPVLGGRLIIKQNGTGNVVVLGGADGLTSITLDATGHVPGQTVGASLHLYSDGTGWFVV